MAAGKFGSLRRLYLNVYGKTLCKRLNMTTTQLIVIQIRKIMNGKMDTVRAVFRARLSRQYCVRVAAVLAVCAVVSYTVSYHVTDSYSSQTSGTDGRPWLQDSYRERLKVKLIQTGHLDQLDNGRCQKRLPKAIIIGVMKAGTEAFATFLGIHPQVAMQFGTTAAMFFNSNNYNKGLNWYRQMMMCSTRDQVTMEKSPQYFSAQKAPERIHKMDPDIKLIVLVRNPIDRAMSHFLQMKYANPERLIASTFEESVIYPNGTVREESPFIYQSTYSVILKTWLKLFSLKQILIIDGDNFKSNALRALHKSERFLKIRKYITSDQVYFNQEKGFYCIRINSTRPEDQELSCLGDGKGRAHPEIEPGVRKKLENFFKPHNEKLFKLIKHKYNWSN